MASAKDEAGKELPPAPPVIPKGDAGHRAEEAKQCKLMARPDVGRNGRRIQLLANHFGVKFRGQDAVLYHYSVAIKSEDQRAVEGKGIGRKVIDKLYQAYSSELAEKEFAYDGEKSLFTVGALPRNIFDFTVILEESSARSSQPGNGSPGEGDRKRSKRLLPAKTFNVEISYAAKIPLSSIAQAIRGIEAENAQEALRVLDIILRQQQAKRGCLLVRQAFFNGKDSRNFCNLGGGVTSCRGFDSSFRITDGGLSLNMDVSTTMLVTPGPVLDFLLANQKVTASQQIDWGKAKRMLRSLRIKARHRNMEYKIIGLSDLPCNQQRFAMKVRNGNGDGQTEEVTVYEYFAKQGIQLQWSAHVPCLDVGKPKRPTYLPMELCDLIPLQRYTKSLSNQQRASLVEKSRQKPPERIRVVTEAVRNNKYDEDPMLVACAISIDKQLTHIDGRVLDAPKLQFGDEESIIPRNGRWNFNSKKLLQPKHIERWAIVNFSARCDLSYLSRELINCGIKKGIQISRPHTLIDEEPQWRSAGPTTRVEKMFELIRAKLPGPPEFLLCVLPERKNSDIYGPWKKKNLHELGIVTQCIAPSKISDQYLTNVLLKINAKLGGMNSLLTVERTPSIPFVNRVPTMIVGMDVSHGSPGRSDIPSIAAVVGSRSWPQVSRYRASVRSQSPKVEMIDALFKIMPNGEDEGMMRELLLDFYESSNGQKPEQVIIFRDGVSDSQFNQVLNIELDQIIKAINHLGVDHLPKFTVIVAQKNHHTKLFQDGAPDNVPPGTVVDTKIVHPRNYDFFMCAHAGLMGTTRPTHYHVLLDEIGFPADDLQQFVHSLSYVYQRSTTAISVVAPICYAHLAAQQISQFVKFEELSDTSSGQVTAAGGHAVPELPKLHQNAHAYS